MAVHLQRTTNFLPLTFGKLRTMPQTIPVLPLQLALVAIPRQSTCKSIALFILCITDIYHFCLVYHFKGRLPKAWHQYWAVKSNVGPPPNVVIQPSVWAEKEMEQSSKKRLHHHMYDKPNMPSYIAKTWDHYNYKNCGAPIPMIMY